MASTVRSLPESIFNNQLYKKLLSLWFGHIPASVTAPTRAMAARWWGGDSRADKIAFDGECNRVCIDALEFLSPEKWSLPPFRSFAADRRAAGQLSAPFASAILRAGQSAKEPLDKVDVGISLCLLLDQMPRNIFREQKEMKKVFSHYDRLSRALVHSILNGPGPGGLPDGTPDLRNLDEDPKWQANPGRRTWFYLPLMHSEDIADHDQLTERYQSMHETTVKARDSAATDYIQNSLNFEKKHRVLLEDYGRYPHRNKALGRAPTKEEEAYLAGGGETFGTG